MMTTTDTKTMTADEAIALVGDGKVAFSDYYKYTFNYYGKGEGWTASHPYGGSADEIYRSSIASDDSMSIVELIRDGEPVTVTRNEDGATFTIEQGW